MTDPVEARELLRWMPSLPPPSVPAIAFPYGAGEYVRLRPDKPRIDKKRKRAIKYEAPMGIPFEIYVPVEVEPGIADQTVELWITEGEKKALAGCDAGLAMIAASGVDCFHDVAARVQARADGVKDWRLHAQLAALAQAKRRVTLVFDSDIDTNSNVQWAAARLITMLREARADVFISFIGPSTGGEKVGLDDLYVQLGRDSAKLRSLLDNAKRPTDPWLLLTWMKQLWGSWDNVDKQRELRRALWIVTRTQSNDQLERWCNDAVVTLPTPQKNIRALQRELEPNESFEAHDTQGESQWLDAPGYVVFEKGVWTTYDGKLGDCIAVAPMNVIEVATDEHDEKYCTVKFASGHDNVTRVVRRGLLAGPSLLELADVGAPITGANRAVMQQFLAAQERASLDAIPHLRVFTQCGWSSDFSRFVLGRQILGGDGRALVDADADFLEALQPHGDERVHRELMLEARRESIFLELGEAAGVAAVLMRLLRLRSMLISIWGSSLGGKSASQALAVSHYGRPERIKITGNATPTALEAALARSRDLPQFIDDTQLTYNQFLLDQIAYSVGAGIGRARGTVTGGMRRLANWLCLAMISGEKPLMRLGIAAGARNRTLELEFEAFKTAGFARQLHRELDRHHGHTGVKIVGALLERIVRPGRLQQLRDYYRGIARAIDASPDEKTDQIALLATGAAVSRIFAFHEDEHDATHAAIQFGRKLSTRLRTTVDTGVDPIAAGYESIKGFVVEHQNEFEAGALSQRSRMGTWIVGRKEFEGRRIVAVLPGPMAECAKQSKFDLLEVVHGLRDRGKLIVGEKQKGGGNRLQRKVPELENARAYCFDFTQDQPRRKVEMKPGLEEMVEILVLWEEDEEAATRDEMEVREPNTPPELASIASSLFAPTTSPVASPGIEYVDATLLSPEYELIERPEQVARACETLAQRSAVGLAVTMERSRARWLTFGAADKAVVLDLAQIGRIPDPLRALLVGPTPKVIHNLDRSARRLMAEFDIVPQHLEDMYAASVLADGYVRERSFVEHGLPAMVRQHLHRTLPETTGDDVLGRVAEATALVRLRDPLIAAVAAAGVERAWKLENEVVCPVASVENGGFFLDIERTKNMIRNAADFAEQARQRVVAAIGDVNLRNNDELRDALDAKCGHAFTTTSALHLRRLAKAQPFLLEIIKFRKGMNYIETAKSWLDRVGSDGRLHPTIDSLGAATGRMSVSNPPLHSVPAKLRECLVAPPGRKLIVADYSMIELAIIADQVGDHEMTACLKAGVDLHRRTAGHLLGRHPDEVTDAHRGRAKPLNFGLVYGMGTETLIEYAEETFGVIYSEPAAEAARGGFFQLYRGVGAWHQRVRSTASKTKEARSASGRLRRFEEPRFTELLNTPVQGTGADGFKRAIAGVFRTLPEYDGRLVHLQHDEIVVEVPEDVTEIAAAVIRREMIGGMVEFVTSVPIAVKVTIGETWMKP